MLNLWRYQTHTRLPPLPRHQHSWSGVTQVHSHLSFTFWVERGVSTRLGETVTFNGWWLPVKHLWPNAGRQLAETDAAPNSSSESRRYTTWEASQSVKEVACLPEHSLFSKKAPVVETSVSFFLYVCVCVCEGVCLCFVFCGGGGDVVLRAVIQGSVYLDVFTSYVHWVELQRESKKPVWFDSLFSLIHRSIWVNEER